ncbi:putative acyl-CoA dehydrogenase [Gordonia araii NBRC 100433]|uniref:Putative acyl-CoA dehydrogenase n=1 Tax=Gordonia araii NBRC 100433 TaxID=1073574 RepID=G7H1K3_9ACTN|nr:acyl-CoA dehydrogenase family protein [Gordonia araii]NNG97763.1 acyl-CoA/acyl-ACP dehydrogenase [Gordonia araii NBRC 100433]GAB09728.1 putative acyl-CoA dehydrogenase [Gordonia araii NBRC 100433]
MDFTTEETTGELTGLARDIATKISTPERVAELEAQAAPLDAALWQELGAAGLIGLELPEDLAGVGGGQSTVDTVAVATEVGRALGVVPYASTAIGVLPTLAGWTSGSRDEWLARVAAGEAVIAAAVDEDTVYDPYAPAATTLSGAGSDGVLRGTKVNVAFAAGSDALLVTAEGDDGPVIVLVETTSEGVSVTPTPSTGLLPTAQVDFSDVAVGADDVVAAGAEAVAALVDRLNLAACAEQSGILDEALRRTASYAAEREQFDRKIGSFQAVAQRLADGYIDVQGLILTTTQAAWQLSEGLDAASAIDTAKFWAGQAGHRVAHTAIHVHGGVGLDTSHPTHRYFLRAKQNEYALAGEPAVLARLGDRLAADPA